LCEQAWQGTEKRVAAPFVLTQPGSPAVLGFHTLWATIIRTDELPLNLMRRVSRSG
jgi:hypothetical protein